MGAGFLWASLICVGVNYAHELRQRVKLIDKTVMLIKQIKIEIEFLHLPVFEMVEKISSSDSFDFLDYLDNCRRLILSGMDFPLAWEKAIKETNLKYTKTEKDKLLLLGESLGASDIQSQLSILNVYESFFCDCVTQARAKEKKYANLYITLGVLFGSMMFIIII